MSAATIGQGGERTSARATVSTNAYVRAPGRAWRDAPIEAVEVLYSGALDRETVKGEHGQFTVRPRATLTIDGQPHCRIRLADGRIGAVTLAFIRGQGVKS